MTKGRAEVCNRGGSRWRRGVAAGGKPQAATGGDARPDLEIFPRPKQTCQRTLSRNSTLPTNSSLTTTTPQSDVFSNLQHLSLKMADKLRTLQQLESLQAKYIGTGHADTTRHEWSQNIVRDSLASYIGHPPLLSYMALGLGENKEIVRGQMIEKMIRASGPPPQREDD